jgi:hypothetical protein
MPSQRPILSPIARPGRRYLSGLVYLGGGIVLALLFVLARVLLG